MRWSGRELAAEQPSALTGLARLSNVVRSVKTPEFAGITFHEVLAKSALNKVPGSSGTPCGWTINPYRGCSHSCVYCFARKTHEYLDLDSGKDFDSEIIVKLNVADVLARELAKASWKKHPVALGTNTDPYQRAEGRYSLMPGIIAALVESGTDFSILTKGTLLRRDLPLIAEAASVVRIGLAMSIAIFDDDLQQSVEPGTPSTVSRLATVTAARDLGLDCEVFIMPVLPYLTDTRDHLERALLQVRDAGATSVLFGALHLRSGAKEWFMAWLGQNHPELISRYSGMYGGSPYAPKEYRKWLSAKIVPMIRRFGLEQATVDPVTGSPRPRSFAGSSGDRRPLIDAELPSSRGATLF